MGSRRKSERMAEELADSRVQIIPFDHPKYPTRLQQILGDGAPPVLFVRGNADLLRERSAAVVGLRKCSLRGLKSARHCVRQLAEKNVPVVSGNAAGVDAAAHQAALEYGGGTLYILAHGILSFKERPFMKELGDDLNQAVVSEFSPRLPWATHAAMQRNRTICALARAVIVVEAGVQGGSFATGNYALRLGVPLFALDYEPVPASAGGNRFLIHKGAHPIKENQEDIGELVQKAVEKGKCSGKEIALRLFPDL